MLAGPLTGIYDPTGTGRILFAFFAAMAETERENIREPPSKDSPPQPAKETTAAARRSSPPTCCTPFSGRANGESVEQIRPDLIIPTGKRRGQHPSPDSIYRALAEHDKAQAYPEAIDQAHADFAAFQAST
jgi:hypothetical protein